MILLIHLYSDYDINNDMLRVSKQIETRQFRLIKGVERLPISLAAKRPDVANIFNTVLKNDRQYTVYGIKYPGCANDNAFILEACGIGSKSLEYSVILDMSNSLDYILHRLTKCDPMNVRMLENYDHISSNILNLRCEKLEHVTLGTLAALDKRIEHYIRSLVLQIQQTDYLEDLTEREVLERVLVSFFTEVLEETAKIKDYCMMYLKKQLSTTFIYRSKSFAASMATSSVKLEEPLVLKQDSFCDYTVNLKSYKRFEYIGGAYES
jgi:hypothetical protein